VKTSRRLQFQHSKYNALECSLRYCVSKTDKYRADEPRYLWYCGSKKYRKGDGTGTVEKWYRGAAVVPWYRATLFSSFLLVELWNLSMIAGKRTGKFVYVYVFELLNYRNNLAYIDSTEVSVHSSDITDMVQHLWTVILVFYIYVG